MPGLAVGGRRPLVEEPRRARPRERRAMRAKTSASRHHARIPLFERGEADLRVDRLELRHGASVRALVLGARTRRRAPRYHPACAGRPAPLTAASGRRPPAITGGPACVYCGRGPSAPGSGRGSGRMSTGGAAPAPTVPARSCRAVPAPRSRHRRCEACYTPTCGWSACGWCLDRDGPRVRGRRDGALTIARTCGARGGTATEEAVGAPRGAPRSRRPRPSVSGPGARSRSKVFEIADER